MNMQQDNLSAPADDDEPSRELVEGRGPLNDFQIERILQQRRDHGMAIAEAENNRLASGSGVSLAALSQLLHAPYPQLEPYTGNPELVVAASPFCEEAEVFRDLRTQLIAKARVRQRRSALAVLSADVGEGKSFIAANLSASFGQLGGRTVLIDANLRTPRLHRLLGIDDQEGLSGRLAGRSRLPRVHQLAQVPGLFFIAAGDVPPNPVELLQSSRFSLLLYELLSRFDHVVLDTPANACGVDGRLIADKAGAVLVVGRRSVSRIAAMQALLDKVAMGPAHIDGIVMNAASSRHVH